MSVYLYSRVSTDEQSVENQKLAAKSAGYAVDYFYSDEGVSGSLKASSREAYNAMLEVLTEGDIVLVAEVSRIGRSAVDVLTNIDILQAKGVKLCVLSYGNLDLTSDVGRLIITMAAAFAQLELSDLKRRTKAGLARTKAAGTRLGKPMAIRPELYEELYYRKGKGASYVVLEGAYGIPAKTIHDNIKKWGDRIEDYRNEWDVRQAQYKKETT